MYQLTTLKNGLTLITIPMSQLDSVTTYIAVGAGSRYETKKINGISHFLEHMFFKGSRKYPTAEIIATLVDGIGAVNNASTSKEWTNYWIKSSSKHLELSMDIISSMLKEPLFQEEEIEREKGVIVEEIRMRKDNPSIHNADLYEMLQFDKNQPFGFDTAGEEKIINSLTRKDFLDYIDSLYSPKNMVLVLAGKLPVNIKKLVEKYFSTLPERSSHKFVPYKKPKQTKPKVAVAFRENDQANLILGMESYDRYNPKRYPANVLGTILGSGMSSRLFIQVRERRGLAYGISAGFDYYIDIGAFAVSAGLKLEKVGEGLGVIIAELQRCISEKVTEEELKKAKEMARGRIALAMESTNYLAGSFGLMYILDRKIETPDEYLQNLDKVTADDVQKVAKEIFDKNKFVLQIMGPFKNTSQFDKILK